MAVLSTRTRRHNCGDLVRIHPVVTSFVTLRADLAATDGEKYGGTGDSGAPHRFGHLHALGHVPMVPLALVGLAAVEAVADHTKRLFDQSQAGQRVGRRSVVGRLAQNPQDLGHLGLGKPDLDLVHERQR